MLGGLLPYSNWVWYVARASGLVATVALTLVVVMGLLIAGRYRASGWPGFILVQLHRHLSLVALVLVGAHGLLLSLDPFARIGLLQLLVPFTSVYRPPWVGFGVLAGESLGLLVLTSLWRERLGYRIWRPVHWLAYLCWPLVIVHGLLSGTDERSSWALALDAACVLAAGLALNWRLKVAPQPEAA